MRYHTQQCEKERFSASGVSSARSSISSMRSSICSLDKFENQCSVNEPEGRGAGFEIARTASPEPINAMTGPEYARTMRAFTMDQLRRDGLEHTVNAKQQQQQQRQSYGGSSGPRGVEPLTRQTHAASSIHAGRPQQRGATEIPRVPRNSPITYGQKKCINSASSRHYRMAPEPLCRDFAAS